ncbi:unnamed protein product, partial [Prorocentrum cordatum]
VSAPRAPPRGRRACPPPPPSAPLRWAMDAWLKAAVDRAATVADAAGKLGEEAQKRAAAAADLLEVPGLALSEGERELTFERGRLGFDLEGVHVCSVEPGSQADQLGVKVGDRLKAIAGYKVPGPKSEEAEEVARARAVAKKWLKVLLASAVREPAVLGPVVQVEVALP